MQNYSILLCEYYHLAGCEARGIVLITIKKKSVHEAAVTLPKLSMLRTTPPKKVLSTACKVFCSGSADMSPVIFEFKS